MKYRVPVRVWSNRGLHKPEFEPVPVPASAFDLVIRPGEIGSDFSVDQAEQPGRTVTTPPVTVLTRAELLDRAAARERLGLKGDGRYALLSLGPGNLKDVRDIARGVMEELQAHGLTVVWAKAPISVRDVPLPDSVVPISVYPLARYLRAFDVFAGAAGYNTCCEVIQSGVPSLLVPNTLVADDQARRAEMVARSAPVVVSPCETPDERRDAVSRLLALQHDAAPRHDFYLDGAGRAAEEILALVGQTVPA